MKVNIYQRGPRVTGVDEEELTVQIKEGDGRVFVARRTFPGGETLTLDMIAELVTEALQQMGT